MGTFYSALTKTVSNQRSMPSYANASKWRKWLDGRQRSGDFRQAERDWSEIDAWLERRGGAYRAEVLEYIRHREVKVTPIELGGPSQTYQAEPQSIAKANGYSVEFDPDESAYVIYDSCGEITFSSFGELETFSNIEDAWQTAANLCVNWLDFDENAQDVRQENDTQYQNHVSPGQYSEYRELLMVIPPFEQELVGSWYDSLREEGDPPYDMLDEMDQADVTSAYRFFNKIPSYTAPHFDRANIVAHARLTVRHCAEGKPFVFIEEIQSDWGQSARKSGATPVFTKDIADIHAARLEDGRYQVSSPTLDTADQKKEVDESNSILAKFNYIFECGLWEDYDTSATYESPYLATPAWSQMALKHVAAWAVDNGYSRIAWTPGQLQSAQNNLSRQVSRIDYKKLDDNEYRVIVEFDGTTVQLPLDAQGDAAWLTQNFGMKVADTILHDGGDITQQTPDGFKSITGANLRLGGAGIEIFYDSIVKNVANKFLKQFGTKTATMNMSFPEIAPKHKLNDIFSDKFLAMIRNDGQAYGRPFSDLYSRLLIARENNTLGIVLDSLDQSERTWLSERIDFHEPVVHPVSYFDINPLMKSRIIEGLPLFSIPTQVTTPVDRTEVLSILINSDIGEPVLKMLKAGTLRVHEDLSTMPSLGMPAAGLADDKGNIHLCAERISKESVMGVLLHEAFHNKVKPLIGDHTWGILMSRLDQLYTAANSKTSPDHHIWEMAHQRVSNASKQGQSLSRAELLSEFGAYAIEAVETASKPTQSWVKSTLGRVKAWALMKHGFQLGEVTPHQLSALARFAVIDSAGVNSKLHDPKLMFDNGFSHKPALSEPHPYGKLCGSTHGLDVYFKSSKGGDLVTVCSSQSPENASTYSLNGLRALADGDSSSFPGRVVKVIESQLSVLELHKSLNPNAGRPSGPVAPAMAPSR